MLGKILQPKCSFVSSPYSGPQISLAETPSNLSLGRKKKKWSSPSHESQAKDTSSGSRTSVESCKTVAAIIRAVEARAAHATQDTQVTPKLQQKDAKVKPATSDTKTNSEKDSSSDESKSEKVKKRPPTRPVKDGYLGFKQSNKDTKVTQSGSRGAQKQDMKSASAEKHKTTEERSGSKSKLNETGQIPVQKSASKTKQEIAHQTPSRESMTKKKSKPARTPSKIYELKLTASASQTDEQPENSDKTTDKPKALETLSKNTKNAPKIDDENSMGAKAKALRSAFENYRVTDAASQLATNALEPIKRRITDIIHGFDSGKAVPTAPTHFKDSDRANNLYVPDTPEPGASPTHKTERKVSPTLMSIAEHSVKTERSLQKYKTRRLSFTENMARIKAKHAAATAARPKSTPQNETAEGKDDDEPISIESSWKMKIRDTPDVPKDKQHFSHIKTAIESKLNKSLGTGNSYEKLVRNKVEMRRKETLREHDDDRDIINIPGATQQNAAVNAPLPPPPLPDQTVDASESGPSSTAIASPKSKPKKKKKKNKRYETLQNLKDKFKSKESPLTPAKVKSDPKNALFKHNTTQAHEKESSASSKKRKTKVPTKKHIRGKLDSGSNKAARA